MARMTFTVPETLKQEAQAHREVNWSAIVARAIEGQLATLRAIEEVAKRSRLSEADIEELAASIDRNMAKRLRPSSSTPTDS